MSTMKIRIANPVALLREMARKRSARNANNQTVAESLRRIKIGEYIDKYGNASLALMVDGIAVRLIQDGNTCDTMRWLRQLRAEYIDKRWQGGDWPGDLDADIKRISTAQAASAHSGTPAK